MKSPNGAKSVARKQKSPGAALLVSGKNPIPVMCAVGASKVSRSRTNIAAAAPKRTLL